MPNIFSEYINKNRNQSRKKNWKIHKCIEIKYHNSEQTRRK